MWETSGYVTRDAGDNSLCYTTFEKQIALGAEKKGSAITETHDAETGLPRSRPMCKMLCSTHLFHSEAHVAAVVKPHHQRVPVRDVHPLSHVKLPLGDGQGVLQN